MITYGSTTLTSYNTITKIEVYYYKSTSATSLSGGSWSTTKPTWENGKYIWQKIRTTYEGKLENGQYYSESDPVNITGQQGATGTAAYSYKLNASDTIVTISKTGIYSTDKITFSATSKQGTGNVIAYSGRFKIETTSDGITWTTRYPASGTGVDESSTEFTIPANISNIRCSLYQTGGMTVLLDIVSVSIVRDGTDAIGLKDSIPFYLASDKETGITIYDEGWSTLRPALDATNKYLWVYYLSKYSDGTTDPELIEVSGDITTFENNGDVSPIYNTIVDIEPIQDLNGFDHAWNGGDGKNLLVYPYSVGDTYTSHDVTFTVEKYPNGAVKDVLINGTASASTFFNFSTWASGSSAKTDLSKYAGQSLIVSGGTNNARISVQYRLPNSTSNKTLANDAGTGATFTVPDVSDLGQWAIFISISNGTVLNNVRVYPMLRFASETDGTYEPYENICPISGWNNVKIERTGKNLLAIKYPNRTNNGITFTVNGSIITANGTATSNAWSSANLSGITSNLQYKNLIPPGQYMLTGGKSTDKKVYLTGNYLDGKSITIVNDYGNGALYTLTDWAYIYPQVQINSGITIENEVFNIQLEATTTATDYEPYCGNTYEIDFPTEAGNIFKGKLVIDENGDGQLIQTHKSIILDNTNRNGYNLYSPNIRPYWIIDDKALFSSYIEANNHIYTDSCIISHSGVINSPQNAKVQALSAYTTKVVYVILINITTQEAMDAYLADHPIQLVYELAEPIIYHLTAKQILAVLKTNHIYANTGNTTVRYYDNQKVTAPYIDYSATSAFEYSAEALEKIDNLEIGGRNLLRMTSMSNQDASILNSDTNFTKYFRRYNGNASQHTFEKIADGVYQDTVALNTSGNLGVAFGRLVSEFNFDVNSEYTLSCWAKTTKANAHLDIGLSYYKDNNTWAWRGGTNPQNFEEIDKWQFFKLTFTPDTDTKAICYCFTMTGEADGTDSFTIRNCKLEKGNKATDWSPAPEDTEVNIQQVQDNLDNLEIGGRNLLLDTATERISPASSNNSAYVAPVPMMSDYGSSILNNRDDYFTYSFDYEVTGNEASDAYIYVQIRGTTVPSASDGYYSYVLENPTGKHCCTFKLTEAQATGDSLYCGIRLRYATNGAILRVWNIKLERGTRATDWTPAPEDAQAEINTALSQSIWYATCDTASNVLIKEATITPTVNNFVLNVGTTVNVKFENANTGDRNSLKLNVNNTGDKDIRYMNNATMVAIPSNGYIIAGGTYLFVYDGTYWVIQNLNYNTNDNYYDRRQHKNNITAATAITAKHLIVGTSAGYKQITSTSGGSLEFDLGYPILWAYSAIKATETSTATYEAYPSVNFSTSGAIQDGAANKMLWLKGTIRGNTFTLASANFLTTRIPTSEDGMYYIPLGIMSSATAGYFSSSNRIYAYVDDAFQPLDNAAALTAIKARSEIVQTQETLSLQIRDISIGGANLFEKTKSFEGIANGDNTHDALTEFVYKDLTVRYANIVTFNNSVVELSAYQFTNLTSDTWYTFSFYAKGNADIGFMYAGSGNAVIDNISVSWNDETYTGFNTTSISSNIIWLTPTDKWQRYSITFHVEEQDITALHRLIGLYARPVSDNVELITETKDILRTESGTDVHLIMEGNEILICGYKLELGNKPTDWTPSDKDKAGYDNIISQINLSQEGIAIRADKIRFEGMITANEGFSIDEYGNMTANNGTFNGVFESYATEINENTFDLSINNGHIHFYNNDRTLTEEERHVGYIGGIRNSVSYVSGKEKNNDAIIIRLDNDCDFIIDSQETSGTERVLRVTNHTNDYISVDFWKDHHIYNGRKIQMYGYEKNQYPEIQFYRYSNDTNNYILRGSLSLHSATDTSDISDRLYLYAKNQGNDLAGDQYLYFAGKGLKYSSSGQPLRTGYVATHKYIATQQFSITDQTITKGSSQNFEIDVTRDGYTPIMCTVTATSGTGAFYLSIYHWTIIGNTVRIFTHNNSTTTDAANITIWVNVLYKLTY